MPGNGLRQVIVLLPSAWLLLHFGGIGRIWYAMWISEASACLYTVWQTRRELRTKVQPLCTGEERHDGR